MLPSSTATGLTEIDVQLAVAVAPQRTTRWTRITTTGSRQVMWLVPMRPGARLDWAPSAWLDALDETTAPRIATRSWANCPVSAVERAPSWGSTGPSSAPSALFVHDAESDVRAHAAARGYVVPPALGSRITEAYARGEVLASVELLGTGTRSSSPTLRVTDDAGAVLPFALTTGGANSDAKLTVFAIGAGPMAVGTSLDVDPDTLAWSTTSNYGSLRGQFLSSSNGNLWLREAASHDVLFAGTPLPDATTVPSLAETYFRAVSDSPGACVASAKSAGLMYATLGHTCPPGALARVAGGDDCTPDEGAISPLTMTCGGADDLALALSDLSPKRAMVTRLAGVIPADTLGTNAPLVQSGSPVGPVYYARSNVCVEAPDPTPAPAPALTTPPSSSSPGPSGSYVVASDGCGGGTVTTSDESNDSETTTSSDDSCGGSSSTGSDGSGWDSSDDSSDDSSSDDSSSDDGSGWDSDDDSSDSSDSCSGSGDSCSSTGGGDDGEDGWDENSAAPKTRSTKIRPTKKKSSLGPRRKRGSSPVSRLALFLVAVVLPLRRRIRKISF